MNVEDCAAILSLRVLDVSAFAGMTGLSFDELMEALGYSEISYGSNAWTLFSTQAARRIWAEFMTPEILGFLDELDKSNIHLGIGA